MAGFASNIPVRLAGMAVSALILLSGCNGLLDPTQVGGFHMEPLVVGILPHLDATLEQPDQRFVGAREVRAEDLLAPREDYVIGANDMLVVTISDLVGPGIETVVNRRVSESGRISLQLLRDPIVAAGLTEAELQQAIERAYRDAGVLQEAHVTVTVVEARNKTFSVIGSVNAPGEYAILKTPTRLLDALVAARDTTLPDLEELYVLRQTTSEATRPIQPKETSQPQQQGTEIPEPAIPEPEAPANGAADDSAAPAEPATVPADSTTVPVAQTPADSGERFVIGPDNRPILIRQEASAAGSQADQAEDHAFEGFQAPKAALDVEVIRIPLKELKNGDFRYNIAIHPGDMIIVPPPVIGEYYVTGNVARPGPYSLTNRKITLKQAIGTATLSPLAIPERTEIIRRIGDDKEMFVRVDLTKIAAGQQPDIYLKPNDVVNVGSNALAPFMYALRNAFRFTYGFGFVYDRNFYDDDDDNNRVRF